MCSLVYILLVKFTNIFTRFRLLFIRPTAFIIANLPAAKKRQAERKGGTAGEGVSGKWDETASFW